VTRDSQRWWTLAGSVLASLCVGFGYAWSVLLKPLATDFGWSAADVSLTFTALMTMGAVAAIAAGKLQQYVQPRTLILLGGALFGIGMAVLESVQSLAAVYGFAALAGFGMGVVYPGATMSNVIRSFPDRRGLTSGVLSAGYGTGAVIWAPLAVFLIDQFGLAWALRIMGIAFFCALAVLSRLVHTTPADYAPQGWSSSLPQFAPSGVSADRDWKSMMRTPDFLVLALLFIAGTLSGMMVIGHASPIAQEILGITPEAAGAIVSLLAVGMVAGKVGWGAISDRVGRTAVFVALFVIVAVALVALASVTNYVVVAACIAVIGLCYGGFLALMGPVTADAFGSTHLGVNFGIMFFTVAISSFVGPRVAAVVADANGGSFSKAFLIAAAVSVLGLMLVGCHVLLSRRRRLGPSNEAPMGPQGGYP
jgi:OFA family oxalate/formate antiporter-like MFS transporter